MDKKLIMQLEQIRTTMISTKLTKTLAFKQLSILIEEKQQMQLWQN